MSTEETPGPSPRATAREDFIKRLFAVTLSVGIASQITRVVFDPSHITQHTLDWTPVLAQWRALLLLGTSLIIVVSSWEGYLNAVRRIPLEDAPRFWIDIFLVFSYLFLTLSSNIYDLWFSIHVLIFLEYLVWDMFRAKLPAYKMEIRKNPRRTHQLSMIVTIVWLAYFVAILALKQYFIYFSTPVGFTAIAVAALAGVVLYRRDKEYRWTWPTKGFATLAPLLMLLLFEFLNISLHS